MNKLTALFCSLALLVALLAPNAFAAGMVEIETPDEVGIGQPFLVKISSRYTLDGLTVKWQGREVKPQVEEAPYDYSAMVILGTSLKSDPGMGELEISASLWGNFRRFKKKLPIVPVNYQKETLSVPPKMVTPPQEVLDRIARERKAMKTALKTQSSERMWSMPFTRPVKGKMLSRFGLYRVFNGEAKRRHTGLDFRAWKGTPLHSMAPGKVILVDHMYFAGNAAVIDHGNGLISMYCHMSKVLVKEGDVIKAGQKVGLSGATGRVTGAHLHLAVFAQGVIIDPEPFFNDRIANGLQ